MKTVTIDAWVILDSNEDYSAGASEEGARENYENEIGALNAVAGFRTVQVKLTIPVPEIATLAGAVPAVGEPSALSVA